MADYSLCQDYGAVMYVRYNFQAEYPVSRFPEQVTGLFVMEGQADSEILDALWPLLSVGKVFGLIPLERDLSPSGISFSRRSFSWFLSIYSWLTYLTIFVFAVIIFMRDLSGTDTNLVEQFLDMVYHLHITATITFCIYESPNMPGLFGEWAGIEANLERLESLKDFESCEPKSRHKTAWATKKPTKYSFRHVIPFYAQADQGQSEEERDARRKSRFVLNCWFLTGGYFGLTVVGAIAYFTGIGIRENVSSFEEYLIQVAKVYILEEYCFWWTGFYVLVVGHIMEVAWAYGDMLIFQFSHILGTTYSRFNRVLEIIQLGHPNPRELEQLRVLHWDLAHAVKRTDACLGLIIMTSFVCNILYLFSRVYLGLAADLTSPNPMIVFEATYAFTYLIGRIFGSAIYASKLNKEANRTLTILLQFSQPQQSEAHYLMMDRFSNQVITANVALSGNGYFVLNQNFIASLISAIVTYEIIIIQFSSS